jgi:hypothetical protein
VHGVSIFFERIWSRNGFTQFPEGDVTAPGRCVGQPRRSRWSCRQLNQCLLDLIGKTLALPEDIIMVIEDTLVENCGKEFFDLGFRDKARGLLPTMLTLAD